MNIFIQQVTEILNVFFSNPFLNWLTGYLTINLKFGGGLHRMYFYRMNGFQNLIFFSIFVYHPRDEKHKENRYLNFKMLPLF